MPATFLTWNPTRSAPPGPNWVADARTTQSGEPVEGSWSVGRHVNIPVGRRVFMLRQGAGPRGIVAAGITLTTPYPDKHFDEVGKTANYVDVSWDAMVEDPTEPLDIQVLLAEVPKVPWNNLVGSGISTENAAAVDRIEGLWAQRLADDIHPAVRLRAGAVGQGRESDTAVRRAIEDYAQEILTAHFVADGWAVEDTRVARPYDAIATRGDEILYLEAKGTRGDGTSVLVTDGEVRWALAHKGQCQIGIVSRIEVRAGRVVSGSGKLVVREWKPRAKELSATAYRWNPRSS